MTADWYARNSEMDHLVRSAVRAEEAVAKGFEQMAANRENSGELDVSRARLSAGEAVGPLSDSIARIEEVAVLPWHRAVQRAKDRYLDHARTVERSFNAIVDNKDTREVSRQITPTLSAAMRALRRAIPALPLHHLERRIDDLE